MVLGSGCCGRAPESSPGEPAPANAAPYHLIKWSGTNICQVWDNGIPTKPFPAKYKPVSKLCRPSPPRSAVKAGLMKKGVCKL